MNDEFSEFLIAGIVGLILAYELNSAAGATIVVCAAIIYFATLIFRNKLSRST